MILFANDTVRLLAATVAESPGDDVARAALCDALQEAGVPAEEATAVDVNKIVFDWFFYEREGKEARARFKRRLMPHEWQYDDFQVLSNNDRPRIEGTAEHILDTRTGFQMPPDASYYFDRRRYQRVPATYKLVVGAAWVLRNIKELQKWPA